MQSSIEYLEERYEDVNLIKLYNNLKEHLFDEKETNAYTKQTLMDIRNKIAEGEVMCSSLGNRYHAQLLFDDLKSILADKFCASKETEGSTRKLNL